jgi:hypothetical protein
LEQNAPVPVATPTNKKANLIDGTRNSSPPNTYGHKTESCLRFIDRKGYEKRGALEKKLL